MTIISPVILWSLTTPPEIKKNGLSLIHIPFIETHGTPENLTSIMATAARSIIVTSLKAVAALKHHIGELRGRPIVSVGPATTGALTEAGFADVTMPAKYTAAGMIELLGTRPPPQPVLFPRGNRGGGTLIEYLNAQKLICITPIVYETCERDLAAIRVDLAAIPNLEIVVLGSPSALNVWKQINDIVKPAPLISTIGPTTAEACRQAGLPVWLEGSGESAGLIEKIIARYATVT